MVRIVLQIREAQTMIAVVKNFNFTFQQGRDSMSALVRIGIERNKHDEKVKRGDTV